MSQTPLEKSTIVLDPRDPMPSARKIIERVYTHHDDGFRCRRCTTAAATTLARHHASA
jgi:hypothetical protein